MNVFHQKLPRRAVIQSMIGSSILLPGIVSERLAAESPLAPRPSQFAPRAKRVIFLYATGGVSHIDTFDPKHNGRDGSGKDKLMGSRWASAANKDCGTTVTDLFPALRSVMPLLSSTTSTRGTR